ncbi:glycoside hydrolase family 2 TIM barrel-domain containing protein, partial [Actinophytocola sp.]|uniref:glycoside hydrolase family 2 protein n=1 Tax=Actinophytocola sp. TaxID=1872138 RepID=UPI0038997FF8
YVPLVVEVTAQLRDGAEHVLAVALDPAPASEPQVAYTGKVTVHKGRMGYGWDFCPRLVQQGLWAPVRLRTTGRLRLADVLARPGADRVAVTVEVDGTDDRSTVECALRGPDGAMVATAAAPVTGGTAALALDVPAPLPWHVNGAGPAHRYVLDTVLRDGSGRDGDTHRCRLGFRDVRFTGEEGTLPYRLTVDGRPTFITGWNWVPADALYGAVDPARLRHLLTLARDAGVSVLRVWGGGLIESETFYDLCDEFGILVWQEFAQSSSGMSSTPSTEPAFVARMAAEAERIVRGRRNHPSLAVWCGGNELQRPDGIPLTDAESPVLAALHEVVARLDPARLWLPTSPSGPVFANTLASVRESREQHDVHGPWEHQGLADHYRLYDEGRALLLSEFGVEGMSNTRAIESVVPAAARVLPTRGHPVWDHLGRWWNNEPLVRQAFGDRVCDLATLSRASQFLQADGLRYAVEANRRRPESRGVLPWQLNESFPNGWCTAAVDYFGEPKAVYHYVRRAYRPLHVCAALPAPRVTGGELTATVWAWADRDPGPARVSARVLLLDGTEVTAARWRLDLGGPQAVGELRCPVPAQVFLLDLSVRTDAAHADNRYVLTGAADFGDLVGLPPARVSARVRAGADSWQVRLRHESGPVAPFLRLLDARPATREGWARLDDNAIDLLPGEERTLTCRWDGVAPSDRGLRLDGWNTLMNL